MEAASNQYIYFVSILVHNAMFVLGDLQCIRVLLHLPVQQLSILNQQVTPV